MRFCKEEPLSVAGRESAKAQYYVHLAPSPYWVVRLSREAGLVVEFKFVMSYADYTTLMLMLFVVKYYLLHN